MFHISPAFNVTYRMSHIIKTNGLYFLKILRKCASGFIDIRYLTYQKFNNICEIIIHHSPSAMYHM